MDTGSSIYSYLRSMKMEQCEQFAPMCSSKCSSSKPVEMLGHESEFVSVPAIFAFKTIHDELLQQVETMSPVTHVAIGTLRGSPRGLYKSTGIEGESQFLAYPARLTVKKAVKAFLEQKNSFEKATFVVDRHTSNIGILKVWTEVPCIQPEGTVTPLQMFVMNILKGDLEQILKYTTERHSLQFQGSINTVPCHILLDTGAS
jgi:hypothetical protein